ncbi:peptidoglycan recognition protein family protein [Haliangium ochraceum]|uniref:N-acetylmuramoyl-L-alanine amidase n=1 Tax=Haliangium ochraceum (strain DSM 14365 / JCM 11303 / SMP-2) TaxID=502025 RepID=D0LV42_HALO1|nr:peptidoglycan recognition family protein [Haliangium ochraceum]ACY15883.1 N-acetylmuramyl-L-alanine amidase, negative regulator of AmpC, AmpD [Haliangium ochraceum DSM 14365]
MSKIWIAGVGFDVDARVIRWDEGPGYNGMAHACINPSHPCPDGVKPFSEKAKNTRPNRYALRPSLRRYGESPPLEAVQNSIRQFIVHHDGCPSAKVCFNVLHNERGLSCHFLMDNDGTIYQTMDLSLMAYHAAGFNARSIGIEICNRGDAKRDPNYYSKKGQKREATTVRIHGHVYKCFRFTPQQIEAMQALSQGISRALPNLPLEYPQDQPGQQAWGEIPNAAQFAGILGHYHTTRRKWDPGPFDFKELCEKSRGSLCFPIFVKKQERSSDRPVVPEDSESLEEITRAMYDLNEKQSEGGYFPVGPEAQENETRLWHGGVHLPGTFKQPVFAPFPARLLAARMGPDTAVGSANFALLRHDMTVGTGSIRFYSLYFHLADESGESGDEGPVWLASEAWQAGKAPGKVVLLNEPIEGGAVIGRYGQGGPIGYRQPQIHFGIFATEEIISVVQPETSQLLREHWQIIDGTLGGRFSNAEVVNDLIDTSPKDGKISRSELLDFFRSQSERKLTRNMAVLSQSEWTGTPDSWVSDLMRAPEFADLGERAVRDLVEEQVAPTLWWNESLAQHAKLPRDGVVYHYHPLSFIRFINNKRLQAQSLNVGIGDFPESDAKEPPPGVTDDFGDVDGDSFVDDAELAGEIFDPDIPLEELIKGFPE